MRTTLSRHLPTRTKRPLSILVPTSLLLAAPFFATASAQPPLETALGPGVPSGTGTIAAGTDLWRVDIDTGAYPEAVCNDESAARIYVRQGQGGDAHRWQLHLQGGGGCRTGQACANRWKHHDTNYGAHKMSTDWAPPLGIVGRGILSPGPRNRFAEWNQVYLYYCSSDSWTGRGDDVSTSADIPAGPTVAYTIDFHGGDIIDAVIRTLRRQNGPVTYLEQGEIERTMPDLDAATDVILSGSSAGGGGVVRNADRVFEHLRLNNLNCGVDGCLLRLAAVPDATYGPDREQFDYSTSQSCAQRGLCTYTDLMMDAWDNVEIGFWQSTGEDSCVAHHTPSGDEWRCADGEHLVENHLAGPFFIRMDTQDNLIAGNLVDDGPSYDGAPVDHDDFGQLVHDQLHALENIATTSEEARPIGPLEPPGAFGAQCQDHVTISNVAHFDRLVAREVAGTLVDTNELLWEWFWSLGEREAIQPFSAAGRSGICGPQIFISGFELGDLSEWTLALP